MVSDWLYDQSNREADSVLVERESDKSTLLLRDFSGFRQGDFFRIVFVYGVGIEFICDGVGGYFPNTDHIPG